MIHLVTFASDDMSRSAELCVKSGLAQGIDDAWVWTTQGLKGTPLYWPNVDLLSQPRGCGYWAWKPFIIYDAITKLDGSADCVVYADAGVEFIEPVQTVIDRMDQDIFLFGNEHEHAHWCKADIVAEIMPEWWYMGIPFKQANGDTIKSLSPWAAFGKQSQASVIFFRVNDYTRAFVKEWLDWCLFEGGRLIDDSPSRTPNHPEFKENRHDQAILTTLAYREGIKLHHWYVTYDEWTPGKSPYYPDEFPRPLFRHHRKRNHQWSAAAA